MSDWLSMASLSSRSRTSWLSTIAATRRSEMWRVMKSCAPSWLLLMRYCELPRPQRRPLSCQRPTRLRLQPLSPMRLHAIKAALFCTSLLYVHTHVVLQLFGRGTRMKEGRAALELMACLGVFAAAVTQNTCSCARRRHHQTQCCMHLPLLRLPTLGLLRNAALHT